MAALAHPVESFQSPVGTEIQCKPLEFFWQQGDAFTLAEMMKILQAAQVLDILHDLSELSLIAERYPQFVDRAICDENTEDILKQLQDVVDMCVTLQFQTSLLQAVRCRLAVEQKCTYSELKQLTAELKSRIQDEFNSIVLLWVEDKNFYAKPELFGEMVGNKFSGAAFDIEESGSCYATGRYTASVFHLMRVAEYGLDAIAKRVGYSDPRPGWEGVLKYIDAQLKTERDRMSDLFKGDLEFIGGISAHMHGVNLAWRRRVAHIERTYTKDQAKRIYDATKGLMEHLAEKLSE